MSSKKKILIIDDEPDIGEYVLDTIMPHYPNSRFISDAKIALSCLQKQSFDLVISDINMPGLRGSELVRNLRAHGDLTLVMFLTGNMSKENVLSALRLGVADVMEKPFNEDELIKTVQRIFEIDKRKNSINFRPGKK